MNQTHEPKLLRLFYVLLFYLIYSITEMMLFVIMVAQSLLNLFGEGPSETIQAFGASLGIYVKQIAEYLSYYNGEKPYPFSDWPLAEHEKDSRES